MSTETQYRGGLAPDGFPRKRTDFRCDRHLRNRLNVLDAIEGMHNARLRAALCKPDEDRRRRFFIQQARDLHQIARKLMLDSCSTASMPLGQAKPSRPRRLAWYETGGPLANAYLRQPLAVF